MSVALPLLDEHDRPHPPRTRGDCVGGPRPCPWTSCRYHLAHTFRGGHVGTASCALDLADRHGGMTLLEIASLFGLSRERIRQVEVKALRHLAIVCERRGIRLTDLVPGSVEED